MLPSTHPAPVLFPPVVQPLSAVGLVRCSQCYPVGYLGTIGGGGNLWRDEWCRSLQSVRVPLYLLLLSAFPIRGRHSGFSFSSFSYQLYPPPSLQPQPCPLSPHP